MLAGAMGAGTVGAATGAAAEPLKDAPWGLEVGDVIEVVAMERVATTA